MTSDRIVARYERTTNQWLASLDHYSEEDLRRSNPDGPDAWTLGQIYGHILDATESLAIPSIGKCLDPQRVPTDKKMNVAGRLIFFIGSFPPIRIRYKPRPDYVPPSITVEEARAGLIRSLEAIRKVSGSIASADRRRKARHPAFGPLNVDQWLLFAEMHLRHHLRQKVRMDKALGIRH